MHIRIHNTHIYTCSWIWFQTHKHKCVHKSIGNLFLAVSFLHWDYSLLFRRKLGFHLAQSFGKLRVSFFCFLQTSRQLCICYEGEQERVYCHLLWLSSTPSTCSIPCSWAWATPSFVVNSSSCQVACCNCNNTRTKTHTRWKPFKETENYGTTSSAGSTQRTYLPLQLALPCSKPLQRVLVCGLALVSQVPQYGHFLVFNNAKTRAPKPTTWNLQVVNTLLLQALCTS